MTQTATRWAEDTVAQNVSGWTRRGVAIPNMYPAIGAASAVSIQRVYAQFTPTNAFEHACATLDSVDADANRATFNILTLVPLSIATSTIHNLFARVQGSGSGQPTDYVRAKALYTAGALTISIENRIASAAVASLASTALGTWPSTTPFWFEFTGSAGTVTATAWAVGTTKPTTPTVTATTAVVAAGAVGLGGFGNGLISAFNFFSIGTGGDTAFVPMLDTEFTEFLRAQHLRRIFIAEFGYTRYDATGGGVSPPVYNPTGKVYISKGGFTSKSFDNPPLQHYRDCIKSIPTFSKRMGAQLSGKVEVSFGSMDVDNPAGESVRHYNAARYSQQFDNAAYTTVAGCSVSANAAIAPDGTMTADTLTDANAVDYGGKLQTITVPNDRQTWRIALRIKKTTGGTAKTFGMNISLTGGVTVYALPRINTDTGATQGLGVVAMLSEPYDYWLMICEITNNASGNTSLNFAMYPAVSTWPASDTAATTGSATIWGLWVYPATVDAKYVETGSVAKDFTTSTGVRDYWTRILFERNDYCVYMGGEDFARFDMRKIIHGRIGDCTAPSEDILRFPIRGLDDVLEGDINPTIIATGDAEGMRYPKVFGVFESSYGQIECPLTDKTTNTFTLSEYPLDVLTTYPRDNGIVPSTDLFQTITAVDNVTGTITSTDAHGLSENSRVFWDGGTPPMGMSIGVEYWVINGGLGSATFRLSATRGGAAITGGSTGTTGTFGGLNYYFDTTGPTTCTLTATQLGRVTFEGVRQDSGTGTEYNISEVYANIVFDEMGVSLNQKDATAFSDLFTSLASQGVGLYTGAQAMKANTLLSTLGVGTLTWIMQDANGLFTVGKFDVPSTTATRNLGGSEISKDGISIETTIRKVDFSKVQFSYAPWFLSGGPMQVADAQYQNGKNFYPAYSYGTASLPMDDFPELADADNSRRFESAYNHIAGASLHRARAVEIYRKKSQIFPVRAAMTAIEWNIGETVQLDHDRFDWKNFSASNPASPDNAADYEARIGVIVGIDVSADSEDTFPHTIRLWRPVPAYFPPDAILENPA